MAKMKIGVIGIGRGRMMWNYCKDADNGEIVAICDKWVEGLEDVRKELGDSIAYYTDYDEFLKHDMDIVMLANYANEHAPFAIKAMESGKNVISEVLTAKSIAEAIELMECVERTGKKYCYAENYCFMGAPAEIRRRFQKGDLGEFEYGEGEYMHNCEPIWPDITYGDKDHWRNNMSAFFYCTHSVGPLLHISGMRPVSVTGFEAPFNARMARMGAKAGGYAVEMVTLENGALLKSLHGVGPSKNSIWYTIYGSKGRMESAREDADKDSINVVYENLDATEGVSRNEVKRYIPEDELSKQAKAHGHGGSDFYCLHNAIDHIAGKPDCNVVDVYEAVDMWLVGQMAYFSYLEGGRPQAIPDLRDKVVRELYRNDRRSTDPKTAGDQLLPSYSKGNPEVPDAVYEWHRRAWEQEFREQHKESHDSQLIMRWTNDGTPAEDPKVPANMKILRFPELENALDAWLGIVRHGLSAKKEGPEFYTKLMTNWPGYKESDCMFVVVDGVPAATVTVIGTDGGDDGYVHMVACRPEYRGLGIGTLMNRVVTKELKDRNIQKAHLTTDDWRIPAIRSYLRCGFVPDESSEDHQKRWNEIRRILSEKGTKRQ